MERAVLARIAIIILFGTLTGPAAQWGNLVGIAADKIVESLPCLVPAAWHVLQAYAFERVWHFACPIQMLVSFLPLLRVVAAAI